MKRYVTEFYGTFFLMLSIILAVHSEAIGNLAPIAIGCTLIGVIYAGGHISKAHYNPAVTLAFFLRGKFTAKDIPGYIIAQLLAVLSAVFICTVVFEKGSTGAIELGTAHANGNILQGMVAEILGSIALVLVILNVATAKSTAGNTFYGVAIGFVVIGCAYILGSYGTFGAYNPGVALGLWMNGLTTFKTMWLTILSNIIGAVLAVGLFRLSYGNED